MISDTSTVWVLVNVYQKDLPYVHIGDPVDDHDRRLSRRFSRDAFPTLPPRSIRRTRTLQARIETNNPGEKLKKDMYVTAIRPGRNDQRLLYSARRRSLARHRESAFRLRADLSKPVRQAPRVLSAKASKGQTQITSGLKAGERVIGDGSLFLQFANSLQR